MDGTVVADVAAESTADVAPADVARAEPCYSVAMEVTASGQMQKCEVGASEPARVESAAQGSCDAEDTDEEDPVVQECDVYLNGMYDPPDFVGDMYVLQYPLRPTYRPYGDQGYLERVDLKHKSRRLRFVYKLQKNDNYDDDSEDRLQRHVLNSVVVANPACSYAVGVVHQGKMTITPLRAVNQLRPDFAHIDQQKQKKQAQAAAVASGKEPSNLATDDPGSGGERVDKGRH